MKRPLRLAGYCGAILIILTFSLAILIQVLSYNTLYKSTEDFIRMLNIYMTFFLSIPFYYGFVVLGKRFKNKLLVVISYITIGIILTLLLLSILANVISAIQPVSAAENKLLIDENSDQGFYNENFSSRFDNPVYLLLFLAFFIILSMVLGVYSIIFGISLLRLKEVKLAKTVGILNIISGATYIIIIGFIVQYVAIIIETLMFFKASHDFEDKQAQIKKQAQSKKEPKKTPSRKVKRK